MQVLDCSIGTADKDSAINVVVSAVFMHICKAFPATAPPALQANVYIVSYMSANLTFSNILVHLT
jgi:hypothetical protein